MRWKELEIHHVDLGLGYAARDWPRQFVATALQVELPLLMQSGKSVPVPELVDHELLAWLVGRPTRNDLPGTPPWPF